MPAAIHVAGRDITDLPVHKRDMGMVFQSYALFPHRTVAENVAFGLRMREVRKAEIDATRGRQALAPGRSSTGLEERRPGQLSGGQQQRVALARAIVDPAAGAAVRRAARCARPQAAPADAVRAQGAAEALGVTLVFVTHDQEEALPCATASP